MFRARRQKDKFEGEELQNKIDELTIFFLPVNLNSTFYNNKVTATKKLLYILKHCERRKLQESNYEKLIFCALTLVYYFGMRLKLSRLTSRYWYWCGMRKFHKAEEAFQNTMDTLLPERSDMVIRITFNFFTQASLWSYESFVSQILDVVLYFNRGKITLFNLLLTDIHYVLFSDVTSARHRMRVLYELLNSSNWVIDQHKLLPFVTRLLDFFAHSIAKVDNKLSTYKFLRNGFEVCIRRIFERVENKHRLMIITTMLNWFSMATLTHEDFLEFSSLLYHAAELYEVGKYSESFGEGLIEHVLNHLVVTTNVTYSLVGCRLLQSLLDRHNNSHRLVAPTLFYDFSQVQLTVGSWDAGDKAFFRRYRERLHDSLLKAVKSHSANIVNIKYIYSIICTMVLEVPCGLTAAAAACMMMNIQDMALNAERISSSSRYWMHAIVVSVMSLICWVHKASMLYAYVNKIISRRAKEAPQLNPPITHYYNVGRHHVTWNKPTLFFEDWELRYALWKHFQTKTPRTLSHVKLNKKVPTLDLRN